MIVNRPPAKRSRFRGWLKPRLDVGITMGLLGLTLPWLSRGMQSLDLGALPWLFDLAAHWQLPMVVLLATCTVARAALGAPVRLFVLPAVFLPWMVALPRLPSVAEMPGEGQPGQTLKLASINLHVSQINPDGLRALLDETHPEIVVLTELNEVMAKQVAAWIDYPEQRLMAEDSPFGIGVISRLAIQSSATHRDAEDLAEIDVVVRVAGQDVLISAVHPMPPLSPAWHQARRTKLMTLVERQSAHAGPRLIVGDLNASPWSSVMPAVSRDYRRANSLAPTWPNHNLGWFGIPIDLVLASEHWYLESFQLTESFGSDHRPVIAELRLAQATSAVHEPESALDIEVDHRP